MASIITGLFESQSQSLEIGRDLENAGIQNKDYILYLHEEKINREIKTSIWQYFFYRQNGIARRQPGCKCEGEKSRAVGKSKKCIYKE